jgi:hypothetical protein
MMTQSQLVILWIAGLLIASILYFIGISKPQSVNAEYERREKWAINLLHEKSQELGLSDEQAAEVLRTHVLPYISEVKKDQEADSNARKNYVTGAVLPVLILAICAFITAGRKN